ncbi:MAG: hypothetical protein ACFFBD_03110 [Candidatus Hodarchaeota archaeon]
MVTVGKNITYRIEGDKLIIEIDLSKRFGESKSGKSITIASTEGNKSLEGREEIKIGLNCYTPKK